MFDVRVMRREGVRIPKEELVRQSEFVGDFALDQANGAKRLRLKSPWTGDYAPVELYDPVLVSARGGTQLWRGYERAGDRGVVQEWLVRARR